MAGLVTALQEMGVDPNPVVGTEGLKIAEANDPYRKVDLIRSHQALKKAAEITNNPNIGLELGLAQELDQWGAFGFLLLNAPTVGDLLKDLCLYSRALQSQASYQCFQYKQGIRLEYDSNHPELSGWEQDAEVTLAFIMGMINSALKTKLTPSEISFQHPPPSHADSYQTLLGTRPLFNSRCNSLCYSKTATRTPIPNAKPELYVVMQHHVRDLLATETEEEQLVNFVRNNISRGLTDNTATLEHIAAEIAMEPRTLQRRLKDEGTNFQYLVDEVRLNRAKYLLKKTRLNITDIALELGYAEASVFVRAFKRLTGETPQQYRKQNLQLARNESR